MWTTFFVFGMAHSRRCKRFLIKSTISTHQSTSLWKWVANRLINISTSLLNYLMVYQNVLRPEFAIYRKQILPPSSPQTRNDYLRDPLHRNPHEWIGLWRRSQSNWKHCSYQLVKRKWLRQLLAETRSPPPPLPPPHLQHKKSFAYLTWGVLLNK